VAEPNPYTTHISRIVDFVLRDCRVKVSWIIVGLDEEEWSKVASERSALDTATHNNWEQIIKLLDDPKAKRDMPTLLKLRESLQLARQVTVEYGTVLGVVDYFDADAMVVSLNEILNFSEVMPNLQPFTLGMAKENCHVDFLIFINSSRFSAASSDEKLTILAHEALHILKSVRNSQPSSFESIEADAKRIVSDFKKQVK